MSRTDPLERGSPVSTNPANFIQGPGLRVGSDSRTARRTNSATDMPKAFASFFAIEYSYLSRLICVRIMLSPRNIYDNTTLAAPEDDRTPDQSPPRLPSPVRLRDQSRPVRRKTLDFAPRRATIGFGRCGGKGPL